MVRNLRFPLLSYALNSIYNSVVLISLTLAVYIMYIYILLQGLLCPK